MNKWSDAFNSLPREIRHIGAMAEAEMRIFQLKREKDRLKNRYNQSIKEVDNHIKNLEDWIRKEEKK